MDSRDGEPVCRNRGDAERGRTSLIHCSNATFGRSGKNCTVTPGGAPSTSMDDAVSPSVASVALGELTVTDFTDPDGEDMFHSPFLVKFSNHSHSNNSPSWLALLLVVLKESLNLHPI